MSVDFVRHYVEHQIWMRLKARPLYLGSMTTALRDLLPLTNGYAIYNTTTNQWEFVEAGVWRTFTVLPAFAAPVNIGVANVEGVLDTINRSDHVHAHPAGLGGDLHHNEDHAARHLVGAADPLQVGVPSNIGVANVAGALTDFVRRDHVHNHPAGLGVNLHHAQLHAATHLVGAGDALTVGAPSNIGTANAEGVLTDFVRRDHMHNHPTGLGIGLHHPHYYKLTQLLTLWDYGVAYNHMNNGNSTANRYYCSPVEIPTQVQIDKIGIYGGGEINSGNFKLGVHDSDANRLPNDVVCETASAAVGGLGANRFNYFAPTSTPTVDPGWYWVGWVCDTNYSASSTGIRVIWVYVHRTAANTLLDGVSSVYYEDVGSFNVPDPMTETSFSNQATHCLGLEVTVI